MADEGAKEYPGSTYLDVDAAVESLIYHGAWKANGLPFSHIRPTELHESWFWVVRGTHNYVCAGSEVYQWQAVITQSSRA